MTERRPDPPTAQGAPRNGGGRWSAPLDAEEAKTALSAVQDIADSLAEATEPPVEHPSLSGQAGLALFFGYLERAGLEARKGPMAARMLERAVAGVAETPLGPGLYGGFTGAAWVKAHLETGASGPGVEGALLRHLSHSPWMGHFDLLGGLVGFGVYALERLPNPHAHKLLLAVVDRLAERAERHDGGLTWIARFGEDHPRVERYPHGAYDVGVAHGVPGVVAFLAAACELGAERATAEELLRGAVAWTLAQALPDTDGSRFPTMFGPGEAPHPARTAWCYGDPGVAASLLAAARTLRDGNLERKAVAWAVESALRPAKRTGVVDAGLCHGSAGLAQVFSRLHFQTGHPALREAATAWVRWTLDHRRPEAGSAGFPSRDAFGPVRELAWGPAPGFLTGAAGIGVALLAAATDVEPEWDRLMLLSSRSGHSCAPA